LENKVFDIIDSRCNHEVRGLCLFVNPNKDFYSGNNTRNVTQYLNVLQNILQPYVTDEIIPC